MFRREDVVEKCAELSSRQFNPDIRYDLNYLPEVKFASNRSTGIIQNSQMPLGFLLRGDIQDSTDELHWLAVQEERITGRCNPALDTIFDADRSI